VLMREFLPSRTKAPKLIGRRPGRLECERGEGTGRPSQTESMRLQRSVNLVPIRGSPTISPSQPCSGGCCALKLPSPLAVPLRADRHLEDGTYRQTLETM
jgi:hypothetical protein